MVHMYQGGRTRYRDAFRHSPRGKSARFQRPYDWVRMSLRFIQFDNVDVNDVGNFSMVGADFRWDQATDIVRRCRGTMLGELRYASP